MGKHHKFDPKNMHKLIDPARLTLLNLPSITDRLALPEHAVLVDVGAGSGLFAGAFLDLLPGSTCFCLDIRQDLVDWITLNRIPEYGDRLKALQCGESTLPLENSTANLIFMITLHHELEDPAAMLAECFRVMKPGGKLLVADWRQGSRPGCPHQDRFLTREDIRKDLEVAGFESIEDQEASESLNCLLAMKPVN